MNERVILETQGGGHLAANVDGYPVELGEFSPEASRRATALRAGLPLASFAAARNAAAQEIQTLIRRLARRGLIEYRLTHGRKDLAVIEPQIAEYWPHAAKLRASDRLVLSRFAYLRRRGNALVLESPRAGALFRICEPTVASFLAELSRPQTIRELKQRRGFPGLELLALLADCDILLTLAAKAGDGLRPQEGDPDLVLWDFHDLVFHTR
ncbi:MAG: dehydrogenase, partial [Gemmatimonas sp.]